jgi:hypothetical protein
MNGFQNPYLNPYGMVQPYPTQQIQQPVQQVTKVNGENGARAYQIGANSSALLLDESGLMVWLVTSDGAGYKTVSAYDITPHQNVPAPDYGSLEDRIKRLEETVNGITRNSSAACTKQSHDSERKTNDGHDQRFTEPTTYDEPVTVKQSPNETGYANDQRMWRKPTESVL